MSFQRLAINYTPSAMGFLKALARTMYLFLKYLGGGWTLRSILPEHRQGRASLLPPSFSESHKRCLANGFQAALFAFLVGCKTTF